MLTYSDIAHRRLHNQCITTPSLERPEDAVKWLGAVQAQDYAGAKWAVGLRLRDATDDDLEDAFTQGAILRTHLLRPTWHFVTPADIRWLLDLTAPRVHAANAYMYRKLELDSTIFERSNAVMANALAGSRQLTRDELRATLDEAGIVTGNGLRMSYIMMQAELDGLVCSGARRGKQFTYMLLDERAPRARTLAREEALAELAERYFLSRAPATVQDFAKWSGLTIADAREGLESVKTQFEEAVVEGESYWFSRSSPPTLSSTPRAYLLSIYDEYFSAYKGNRAMVDDEIQARLSALGNALTYTIVVNGRVVGSFRRTLQKREVIIETNYFISLTEAEQDAVTAAAHHYGDFLGLAAVLT